MNIVCGTDFSDDAKAGATVAATLTGKLRDRLLLVHALPGGGLSASSPEAMSSLFANLSEKLAEEGARLAQLGAEVEPHRVRAPPDHALLVTGAHQRHGMERLFHLSVSRAWLRYAPMTVLVVPATSDLTRTPPAAPHRVLAATDFSDAGNDAVRHASSLLRAGGTVLLLHVVHPQAFPNGAFEPDGGNRQSASQHADTMHRCADQLRVLAPTGATAHGIVTEVEVLEHPKPARAIAQAAERFGADVICLGTHGRSRFSVAVSDSVTQTVMRRSARPLLVVHAPPE